MGIAFASEADTESTVFNTPIVVESFGMVAKVENLVFGSDDCPECWLLRYLWKIAGVPPVVRWNVENVPCVWMMPNLISRKTLQAIAFSIATLGMVNIAR